MIASDLNTGLFVRVALFTAVAVRLVGAATPNPPPPAATPTPPTAGVAAPVAPAPATQTPAASAAGAPVPVRFQTKARRMSTYQATVRFEVTANDVRFEAPEVYRDGFDFWASRMKGQTRSEVYEMVTMTEDANDK